MNSTSLNAELVLIREAADLLAQRFSMIGDLLRQVSATFAAVRQTGAVEECPERVKEEINTLATEVQEAGGSRVYAERVQSFEANAVIGRILDLGEEISKA